jgi:nitrate reductase NapAB chaperone NapD
MPVSGLVVALSPQPELRDRARAVLGAHPRVTLGEMQDSGRLPIVLEGESAEAMQADLDMLTEIAGVELVELAYVELSDVQTVQLTRKRSRSAELGG